MTRLEQLKNELHNAQQAAQNTFVEYLGMSEQGVDAKWAWKWYNEQYSIQHLKDVDAEIRLLETDYTLTPFNEGCADLFTLQEFIDSCLDGVFIDDDGFGYYATNDQESDIEIHPSDVTFGRYREDFTHVIWYNN